MGRTEVDLASLWECRSDATGRAREVVRQGLIERYLYLVKGTLKRLSRAPERYHDDMAAAGRLALVRAVDRYDPSRGVDFVSFALSMIRGAMLEELRREDWVPRRVREAQKRGEPVQVMVQLSLESVLFGEGEGEELTLLNSLSDWEDTPDVIVPKRLEAGVIQSLVRCLPTRERRVVILYYWQEESFAEIARRLGVSESRVHQNYQAGLLLLSTWLGKRQDGSVRTG